MLRWRQISFQLLGILCIGGGLFAFYDYGTELLPLFTQFLAGTQSVPESITVLLLFFLGAPALVWMGTRLIPLRSFSNTCLSYAVLPIIVWAEELYKTGHIDALDRTHTFSPVFLVAYIPVLFAVRYLHAHWYTPISHDGDRQVRLEEPSTSFLVEFKWAIVIVVVLVFIIFNPSSAIQILNSAIDALIFAWDWVQG